MVMNAAFQPLHDEYYKNNPAYLGHQYANDVRYQDPEFRKQQAARLINNIGPVVGPLEGYWILHYCKKEVKEFHLHYLKDLSEQNWNNLSSFDRCLFRIEDCVHKMLNPIFGDAPPSNPSIGRYKKYLLIGSLLTAASLTTVFFCAGKRS